MFGRLQDAEVSIHPGCRLPRTSSQEGPSGATFPRQGSGADQTSRANSSHGVKASMGNASGVVDENCVYHWSFNEFWSTVFQCVSNDFRNLHVYNCWMRFFQKPVCDSLYYYLAILHRIYCFFLMKGQLPGTPDMVQT